MEFFRVGGAVRDRLLGLTASDTDWVVVGATPEAMMERGFKPVGRDFPVFLDPERGEEYALARTERKTAPGYRGFTVHASPEVTLEEDLARRDLTINAIAEDADGGLIDPFQGQRDLEARVLRHVSPAFVEDPVRLLRVARLAAQLAPFGFEVAAETRDLMRDMVRAGEVDALVAERVWQEMHKALAAPQPGRFISELRACGALARLLPELDRLWGVPQVPEYHPEVDCGEHMMLCLARCAERGCDAETVFAVLLHDLGKGVTPAEQLPSHRGHEQRGLPLVDAVCKRFRVPGIFHRLARLTCEWHLHAHRVLSLRPGTLLKLLSATGVLRDRVPFDRFVEACTVDKLGRGGAPSSYPQATYLRAAADALVAVRLSEGERAGLEGAQIGERLRRAQLAALSSLRRDWPEAL